MFRCVKGEGEIEKLQAKVVELRRKVEDTTAAMQELGRENQSLQVSREAPQVWRKGEAQDAQPRDLTKVLTYLARFLLFDNCVVALVVVQIKQSQSLTRKWAEDNEVQNCMACGKGFSVTVRKVRTIIEWRLPNLALWWTPFPSLLVI